MKNRKSILGFTLIELLIVITIIGILAVVFLPTILGAPEKARDATRQAALSNAVQAIEAGRLEGEDVDSLVDKCLSGIDAKWHPFFGGSVVPTDPLDEHAAVATVAQGCGDKGEYFLDAPTAAETWKYRIYARMEMDDNMTAPCPVDAKTECYMVEMAQ